MFAGTSGCLVKDQFPDPEMLELDVLDLVNAMNVMKDPTVWFEFMIRKQRTLTLKRIF